MTDAPILLVEDNPDDVELTIRALRRNDIPNEVVVAADGQQALNLLTRVDAPPLRPALVLLDVNLPRVDGLEVLRRIKADEAIQMVPVVVLTTSNEECDIVHSYRLGANSFIRKPVSFTEFVAATQVLGRYWLELNQPVPAQRAAP